MSKEALLDCIFEFEKRFDALFFCNDADKLLFFKNGNIHTLTIDEMLVFINE